LKYVICLTTVGSRADAARIARAVVRRRLAACVTVIPGSFSLFMWKKRLCQERECLLILKTSRFRRASLEAALKKIHPYKLPEFLVLPVSGGSRRYLNWIRKNLDE